MPRTSPARLPVLAMRTLSDSVGDQWRESTIERRLIAGRLQEQPLRLGVSNVRGTSETRSARSATFATWTPERFATLNVQAALAPIVVGLGVTSITGGEVGADRRWSGRAAARVGAGAGGGGFFAFTKIWKILYRCFTANRRRDSAWSGTGVARRGSAWRSRPLRRISASPAAKAPHRSIFRRLSYHCADCAAPLEAHIR